VCGNTLCDRTRNPLRKEGEAHLQSHYSFTYTEVQGCTSRRYCLTVNVSSSNMSKVPSVVGGSSRSPCMREEARSRRAIAINIEALEEILEGHWLSFHLWPVANPYPLAIRDCNAESAFSANEWMRNRPK